MVIPKVETGRIAALFALLGLLLFTIYTVHADPTGATILSNSTAGSPSSSPGNRADSRGTITTVNLDALQQDQQWKAYVGNVSGRLSLDDATGFTIYDWTLAGAVTGEVYVARYSTITFTNISCANQNNITAEHPYYNMTISQSDSINRTYNETSHRNFQVGATTITANSCRSTATYVNDTRQNISGNQFFQSLILQDNSDRLVWVTLIDDDAYSYDNNISINKTNDFQIIVPESDINSTPTTYYFWTELG